MKKASNIPEEDDGMLPEYDFKGKKGMRGKYYLGPNQAHTVRTYHKDGTVTEQHFSSLGNTITLDPDVMAYFPDSESVNKALRTLIALVPNRQLAEKKAKYAPRKEATKKITARK
jgi:hypothetical protein